MTIKELTPLLWTEDLPGTIAFYQDTLGFICGKVNEDWGWATLMIDDVRIMLANPNAHVPYEKIGFTGSFYFLTDDVEAMWLKLKDKANVGYGIETFDWGMREFAIFDNNGYTLQFGQEILA